MNILKTPLEGLVILRTQPIQDDRGQFVRLFCEQALAALRPNLHFTQINLSETAQQGTVRGMHCQRTPMAECKLIRCIRGRVYDVAVDLRQGSPTFLQWYGIELSSTGVHQIFIPEGFAHGFQVLEDHSELLYLHTRPWSPAHEFGVRWDDPALTIDWPLTVSRISDKDRQYALIEPGFEGLAP